MLCNARKNFCHSFKNIIWSLCPLAGGSGPSAGGFPGFNFHFRDPDEIFR